MCLGLLTHEVRGLNWGVCKCQVNVSKKWLISNGPLFRERKARPSSSRVAAVLEVQSPPVALRPEAARLAGVPGEALRRRSAAYSLQNPEPQARMQPHALACTF